MRKHGHEIKQDNDMKGYKGSNQSFSFTIDDGVVTGISVVKDDGNTIALTLNPNDDWSVVGGQVYRVYTGTERVMTTVFSDSDDDGKYTPSLQINVLANPSSEHIGEFHFSTSEGVILEGDTITADTVVSTISRSEYDTSAVRATLSRHGRGHHGQGFDEGNHDANLNISVVKVNGDLLIVNTSTENTGNTHFQVFRDDDGDGNWTAIAEGYTDGVVDIVGLSNAGLLVPADGIVG